MTYGIVFTTTSGLIEAKKIAYQLVENKLAACVNIIPKIQSIYSWKGEIVEDEEFLLFIKTKKSNFESIKQCIRTSHSYELPEIIMLPIEEGLKDYLCWIEEQSTGKEK